MKKGSTSKSSRRLLIPLFLAISMMLGTAVPALAGPQVSGHVYRSDTACTWARSGLYTYYIKSESEVAADWRLEISPYPVDCLEERTVGANYLAVKSTAMVWNGSSWDFCAGTDWAYNPYVLHAYTIVTDYGNACGRNKYYQNVSDSYVYNDGWKGGYLWSGYIYYASGPSLAKPTPPPAPAWVKEDGATDVSKLPESFRVVGQDGEPVRDAKGNIVYIKTSDLAAPPPLRPDQIKPHQEEKNVIKIGPNRLEKHLTPSDVHFFA
ncbi:hypothetical protein [Nonomuraea sp. NPDC046570]|uniref:hypothetical protein n=1 Tax=Nonomuraea sp. NPDC046570 TaxID=3155255 RepID=UPI0033F441AE